MEITIKKVMPSVEIEINKNNANIIVDNLKGKLLECQATSEANLKLIAMLDSGNIVLKVYEFNDHSSYVILKYNEKIYAGNIYAW